ncbi:MAG: LytTR family DNA-binding domain-containing protein [Flavobacteriaceae bacterium]|nr:LytTR family DNA-binding domain-containing protein [Flavobacteriaceae bacterium]
MTTIKTILADDEISNLKGLKNKLEKFYPQIEILHCLQDPEEALTILQNTEIDLLFLDIKMPRMNGFELLASLKNISFEVVFVTAFNDYALEAFKQNAIDYVLKPIDDTDLRQAVEKAISQITNKNNLLQEKRFAALLSKELHQKNKLSIPTSKGISFIPFKEILRLEGYQGYTKIHLMDKSCITSSYNLGKFEKMLRSSFFKCHKSHIVNISTIRHLENEGYLVLDEGSRIPFSKSVKTQLLAALK